ncbi:MAG TPA: lysylphosphatidylglycerol synthase transmembrane domain-containing protein [Dongiaceae bacterium]|nr:lysylphosphatidylglycerol synthase transmembrane domain-containing protein [Dongiaceae bacterium]
MTIGRRHYLLTAQILISGALLAWLISFTRPGDLVAAARDVSPLALLVTGGMLAICNGLAAFRQSVILRAMGIDVSLPRMLALNWMGLFANNFLPSSVGGDAAIAAVLQRRYRRLGTIVSGLLINRIFGLVGLMIVLLILFIVVDLGPLQVLVNRVIVWSVALLLLAVLAGIGLILLMRGRNRLSRLLMACLEKLQAMGVTALSLGRTSFGIFLLSIGIMLLSGSAVGLLGRWQYPPSGLWTTATIILMLQLVQLIPISFNGIGVAESVTAYCLTRIGWPLHEAVLFGLLLRGISIALSLPGVLGYFFAPPKTAPAEAIPTDTL